MEVSIVEKESIPIINIVGEISLYDIDLIILAVAEVRQKGRNKMIVNMQKVPFMDSSGIGVFMQSIVSLSKDNGLLYFANCSKRIQVILNFSLENTTSRLFDTEEEAVIAIKKNYEKI